MKQCFFLLSFCFITNIQGQISNLNGNYFSNKQDRFCFNLSKGYGAIMFENAEMYHLYFDKEIEIGDTLKLYLLPDAIDSDKEYIFQMLKENDSFFIIKPISKSAQTIFSDRKQIKFIKEEFLPYDSTINFEKLEFIAYSSHAFISTGVAVKIDNNKNIFFRLTTGFDSLKNENFKGEMTDEGYNKLVNLIRIINIRKLKWPVTINDGQQEMELIIYYNNQRKKLIGIGDTPYISNDLILFLMNIKKYCIYQHTDEELKIKN
jgi:hypothetical protein